jgi:multisubunit Na+/H+ antiporter MnhB subunit
MQNRSGETMLAIRLYVCALTLGFLVLVTIDRGIGFLEGVVITCAIVYLILDTRADLKMRQDDLRQLEQLEKQMAVLLSD